MGKFLAPAARMASVDPSASAQTETPSILVMSRYPDAADCIQLGAGKSAMVFRTSSIDAAIVATRTWHFETAFVDCDLPKGTFQKLASGRSKHMRIIGIRDQGSSTRPIALMAERLISAYVRVPLSMAAVAALIRPWHSRGCSAVGCG